MKKYFNCRLFGAVFFTSLFLYQNCSPGFKTDSTFESDIAQFETSEGGRSDASSTMPPTPATSRASLSGNFLDEIYAGYQGWFETPQGTEAEDFWIHWRGETDGIKHPNFDITPDTSFYAKDGMMAAPFVGNYNLFSSTHPDIIDQHMKWLKENNIDGVALQYFIGDPPGSFGYRLKMKWLERVRVAAEKYGRKFYIMYDISNGKPDDWHLITAQHFEEGIVNTLRLTDSPSYARQGQKPVISIWGPGFKTRTGTPAQTKWLIDQLRSKFNAFIVGGVPYTWRQDKGKKGKPEFYKFYYNYDSIQPWTPGLFSSDGVDKFYNDWVKADLADIRAHNNLKAPSDPLVQYQIVVFPGFSWRNLKQKADPLNQVPRNGGKLLWRQIYNARQLGIKVYYAMLDEYDEGTALLPAIAYSNHLPPTTDDYRLLALDADGIRMSPDFYLRLAGEGATLLKQGLAPYEAFKTPHFNVKELNGCGPYPHYIFIDGLCLPSCGALGGPKAVSSSNSCSSLGMKDAGESYDSKYCCVPSE